MSQATLTPTTPLQRVIDYIAERQLQPGAKLPSIKRLARELDLSPHMIRDVILQAQTVGLVRVRPRSGVYVESPDDRPYGFGSAATRTLPGSPPDADLFDVLEARRVIESELAGMAAARRRLADLVPARDALQKMYADVADYGTYVRHNEEFHYAIAGIAGNRVLLAVLRQLVATMRVVLIEHRPGDWPDSHSRKRDIDREEHEAIFAAVLAGDPAAARTAMQAHLRDTTDSLMPNYASRDA